MATAGVKLKLLIDIRQKRRRDGTDQLSATGVTSDSKLASCFIHKVHCDSLVKNGYYILVGARIQTRSDVTYIDVMEGTKVSMVKMTMKQIGTDTLKSIHSGINSSMCQ